MLSLPLAKRPVAVDFLNPPSAPLKNGWMAFAFWLVVAARFGRDWFGIGGRVEGDENEAEGEGGQRKINLQSNFYFLRLSWNFIQE